MSFLSKLFGQGGGVASEPENYNGYLIFPEAVKGDGGYRIGARIEREIGGDTKIHHMIRADTYGSADVANEASITKAKQLIDQQGEMIFD